MELLTAIALLCQVNLGQNTYYFWAEERQLKCQKQYLLCVKTKTTTRRDTVDDSTALRECILEKK